MRRQILSAAATATALLLCFAATAFMVIAMLPNSSSYAFHPMKTPTIAPQVQNLGRAAMTILFLGYGAGLLGWLATFVLGCDGMHRLASVLNQRRSG